MIVCWNAWPMCSVPVTFGGGSRMQYGSPSPCGANTPAASQRAYHFDSIVLGSKLLSMGNRGFGIRDSGFGIRDSGFGIRDSGFGRRRALPNPQSPISNPTPYISNFFTSN